MFSCSYHILRCIIACRMCGLVSTVGFDVLVIICVWNSTWISSRDRSLWIAVGKPWKLTCPKRSCWKIHSQSPPVPFSRTKSMHGLGERTWGTWTQRLSCGTWPKFGEDHSSPPAFCRKEKYPLCAEIEHTRPVETNVTAMIWTRQTHHRNVILLHGEIWAVNLVYMI